MTLLEAVDVRHSVRRYKDEPLSLEQVRAIRSEIEKVNAESGLHFQLVLNEPHAFQAEKPSYGSFSGVRNYLTLIGPKGNDLDEKLGYYGEHLVLFAQTLGVSSCWVGLTYRKTPDAFEIREGEKLRGVIALGIAADSGHQHHNKPFEKVTEFDELPEWFIDGVNCALKAPTAVNQQKFRFILKNGVLSAKAGLGFYAKMDLGIVKYHFELASGKKF